MPSKSSAVCTSSSSSSSSCSFPLFPIRFVFILCVCLCSLLSLLSYFKRMTHPFILPKVEISIFIEKITPTYCLQIRVPTVLMLVRNKLMHILQRGGEHNTSFIFFLPEGGMKINIPLQGEGYKERDRLARV